MNAMKKAITAMRTPLVQTLTDHTTVLVILAFQEMGHIVKVGFSI